MGAKRESGVSLPPKAGEVIAEKYVVERVLGQGGMGMVIAAHHVHLDQRVAMKFLLPSSGDSYPGAIARFLREARAAARIQNEHVGRVLDVGTLPPESGGAPFIVMEYLDGLDLAAVVKSRGSLPIEEAIAYVLQACEAIAEAHALGIVHRDLKPSNLFLARRSDHSTSVKLIDFGIAKAPEREAWSEGALTGTGGTMGSPQYMSPEHVRSTSEVDARTDIWAIGVILHELVSGRLPFEAPTPAALCAMIAADPPTPLRTHRPDAPAALEAVIAKCLEKKPAHRYQTIAELVTALAPMAPSASRISIERVTKVAPTLPSLPQISMDATITSSGPIVLQGESRRSSPDAVSAPTLARTTSAWQSAHLPAPMRLRAIVAIAMIGTALLTAGIFLTMRSRPSEASTAASGRTGSSASASAGAGASASAGAGAGAIASAGASASAPANTAASATANPKPPAPPPSKTAKPTTTSTPKPTTTATMGGADDDPIGSRK